jgi:microcystin-dependent protein
MTLARMEHSGNASPTSLQIGINAAAASIVAVSGVGFPTGAVGTFVIVIDPDLANEEKILCATRSTNTFSVAPGGRGYDGTTATDHSSNATIKHVWTANEADDTSDHIYNVATRDDHTQYLTVARHDITARHVFGVAFPTPGAASVSAVGDSAGPGVATGPARADHIHGREPWAVGASTAIPPGTTAADGTSASPSRADHVHSRAASESFTNVTATGSVTAGSMTVGGAAVMPPGIVMQFAAATAPTGWLTCDGSLVLRATYPALFAVIGSTWGADDGSTNFRLPDMRGRAPIGTGTGTYSGATARALAAVAGEETTVLTTANLAAHNHGVTESPHSHGVTDPNHTHSVAGDFGNRIAHSNAGSFEGLTSTNMTSKTTFTSLDAHATGVSVNAAATGVSTQNNGSGTAHNTMQPSIALTFIIKT